MKPFEPGRDMEQQATPTPSPDSRKQLLQEERNCMALILSIVPGLGQIYKGYKLMGILIMVLGIPMTIWAAALLFIATFGAGILLIPFAWAMVALHAFTAEDHRHHHLGVL